MLLYLLSSSEKNIYKNLAYETYLVNYVSEKFTKDNLSTAILFLWQNNNTIVVGKHQNIYKECNMSFVKENNIALSRRITGGGAVYHDIGNLNFSFISSKDIYDKAINFKILIEALKKLKINAELSGRNDILINNKKFSGNAFFNNKYCSLHHGTILINSCDEIISKCLTPNKFKLKSKGVDSVKSRIINLKELDSNITVEKISEAIKNEFVSYYKSPPLNNIELDKNKLNELYKKYSSKGWIYQNFVDNGIELSGNFPWGNVAINILVKDDKICNFSISTDSLETEIFDILMYKIKGIDYKKRDLETLFKEFNKQNCDDLQSDVAFRTQMINDIRNLIISSIK